MVLKSDVLWVIHNFFWTEILKSLHVKVVDIQILTIVLWVIELANAVINNLSSLRPAFYFLFLCFVVWLDWFITHEWTVLRLGRVVFEWFLLVIFIEVDFFEWLHEWFLPSSELDPSQPSTLNIKLSRFRVVVHYFNKLVPGKAQAYEHLIGNILVNYLTL